MDLIDLEEETIDAEILDSMAVSQEIKSYQVHCYPLLVGSWSASHEL